MTETNQGSKGSAFISYSRKDKPFVVKLNDALDNAGVQAWVDWEGIELASDWMERITTAIQSHNAFIFVISPDSVASKVCADELELGLNLNKKLIPILYREPKKGQVLHEKLAATNWVYLREKDNFDETIPKLVEAIQTDLEWVNMHTQLLNQAKEWEDRNKNNSFLLSGTKLQDAERWMADASGKDDRQILPLQADYISTSRSIATRNQRRLTITMSLLVVAAIVFGIFALISRNLAKESEAVAVANEHIAATQKAIAEEKQQEAEESQKKAEESQQRAEKSRELAEEKTVIANAERSVAQAQILQSRAGSLDESTLLAIESYNLNPTFQAENIIRINSSLSAIPVKQLRQDGAIWNIEWSPDFEYFVVGNNSDPSDTTAENKACVYRADNGEVYFCVSHTEDINDAIFTKDGSLLVTASADNTARFWDAKTGDLVNELIFDGAVLDLDANDTLVAIAREDNFISFYYLNKPDLKPNPINVAQEDGVRSLAFSRDGKTLALGLQNGKVRLWNSENSYFYNGPTHEKSSYVVLAWSPDNLWLASGGGDSLAMITKRDGSLQYKIAHQDWVEGVAFGPDPSWFATASDDKIIRVVDTDTGVELFRMSHTHFAQRVIVSPDGQWLASTGYDRVVRIWDTVSGTQLLEIPLDAYGSAISFNKDSSRIVVADENGNVGIWDISSLNSRLGYIEFTEFVREAHFTPSGESLIINSDDYTIRNFPTDKLDQIKDVTEGKIVFTAESLTYHTTVSPDSQWVAAVELDTEDAQKNRGTLASIDGETQTPLEHGGEVTDVAFTHDNQYVATAGLDGLVWFWNIESGDQEFNLNNGETAWVLAISPTDTLAAVGLHDRIALWDWSTQSLITELPLVGDVTAITFSQDGILLAAASTESFVNIWKVDGKSVIPVGTTMQMSGLPRLLAFSPDSKWLAGGGTGGFAYLWDTASTQEFARIPHGNNSVTSVAFSMDGTQFLTVSRKVVRIWNITTIPLVSKDKLIDYACTHLVTNFSTDEWKKYFGDDPYRPTCPALEPRKEQ